MKLDYKEIKKHKCDKCKKHQAKSLVAGEYICKHCEVEAKNLYRKEFGGKMMRQIKNKQEIKRRIKEIEIEQKKKFSIYRQTNITLLKKMLRRKTNEK